MMVHFSLAVLEVSLTATGNCATALVPKTSLPVPTVGEHYLRGPSALGFGWWSGPPPPMIHQSPHGSFYLGWENFLKAGAPPEAACHTCLDCPEIVCVLPS